MTGRAAAAAAAAQGQYQPALGQTSVDNCTACDYGTYAPLAGSAACTPCPQGQFGNETGMAGCQLCPAGMYGALSPALARSRPLSPALAHAA